jgi:hypothetical protein
MSRTAERTWKPITAGVLSIVSGALCLALGLLLLLLGGTLSGVLAAIGLPSVLSLIPVPILGIVAVPLLLLGVGAVVGGSYAVRRRMWPLALAGAICALFPPQLTILGVLAIVFVVLGKDEFV